MKHPLLCLLLHTLSLSVTAVSVTHPAPDKVALTPEAVPKLDTQDCHKENAELNVEQLLSNPLISSLHPPPPESLPSNLPLAPATPLLRRHKSGQSRLILEGTSEDRCGWISERLALLMHVVLRMDSARKSCYCVQQEPPRLSAPPEMYTPKRLLVGQKSRP